MVGHGGMIRERHVGTKARRRRKGQRDEGTEGGRGRGTGHKGTKGQRSLRLAAPLAGRYAHREVTKISLPRLTWRKKEISMQHRQLGNSDVKVSPVIFGAWAIGGWMWGGNEER